MMKLSSNYLRALRPVLLILCVLFSGVGCSSNTYSKVYDIRLMQLDDVAESYLEYVAHRRARLSSGELKLYITILNTHRTKHVSGDWKVVFYDDAGFEVEKTEWNTVVFPNREKTTIEVSSIRKDVSDFMLLLRGSQS